MRFNSVLPIAAAAVSIAVTTAVNPASAFTIGFNNITTNNGTTSSAVSQQLSAEVTAVGSTQAQFVFRNLGAIQSIITEIYLDDRGEPRFLSSLASITGSTGVSFTNGTGNIPSPNGVSPSFTATAGLGVVRTNQGGVTNGVNNGSLPTAETLTLLYNLGTGRQLSDLSTALASGALRIGMHVQSIGVNSGSDSFVSNPNAVPEPFTIVGSGVALGVGAMMRKKQQKKEKSIG